MVEGGRNSLAFFSACSYMSTESTMGTSTHPRGTTSLSTLLKTVIYSTHNNLQELKASMPKPPAVAPQNPAAVTALKHLKERVKNEIQKYRGSRPDVRVQRLPRTDDFARLARRICGVSIGIVLGGGGARGISHLVSYAFLPHTKRPLNLFRGFCAR